MGQRSSKALSAADVACPPQWLPVVLMTAVSRSALVQYTPDQADWSTFQSKPLAVSSITAHDPDSIGWITAAKWKEAEWDGTIYNPSQMSRLDFSKVICPDSNLRGIRELFYDTNPFANNTNPTKAEVDEWHRVAINHVRALVNYTGEDRQVKKDHCTFARALWGDERKFSTKWDAKYSEGELDSPAGPCKHRRNPNMHCGATFLPDASDQASYLPDGHDACTITAGSEGVQRYLKSDIPWSVPPCVTHSIPTHSFHRAPIPSPSAGLSSGVVPCAQPWNRKVSGEQTVFPFSTEKCLASASGTVTPAIRITTRF